MKDLTQGPILKLLLGLTGTILISSIMGTVFSLVNIFWVGRLGAQAQAATALAINPIMIVQTIGPIISVGARILIAQSVGAKDRDRARLILNEALGATLLLAFSVNALLWFCRPLLASWLTTDPSTASLISDYLRWLVPAIAMQLPVAVLGSALSATGNMRANMLIQTGAMVLTLIVSPFLMFGWLGAPRMGVAGAGFASFLASGLCLFALVFHCSRPDSYLKLQPRFWFSRPTTLWSAVRIGSPTCIEGVSIGAYLMLLMFLLRPFGTVEQASFGIGQRLLQAGIMPLMALANAASVIAGQNFGAGLGDRVRQTFRAVLKVGLVATPVLCILMQFFAPAVCRAFTIDPGVVEGSAGFTRIVSLSLIPESVALAAMAVLIGMGNTRASLLTSLTHIAIVIVPAFALAQLRGFRPDWLWEEMVVASFVEMAMALWLMHAEFGKRLGMPSWKPAMDPEASP